VIGTELSNFVHNVNNFLSKHVAGDTADAFLPVLLKGVGHDRVNCINKGMCSPIQSNYTDSSVALPKIKLWYDRLLFNSIVLTLLKQGTNKCIFLKNNMYIALWKE